MPTFTQNIVLFRSSTLTAVGCLCFLGLTGCIKGPETSEIPQIEVINAKPVESVAALGQLSPYGQIRQLAAPVSGFGGTPRVSELLVEDGDLVDKGQILAVFDNQKRVLADLDISRARLQTLVKKISIQQKEISRYEITAIEGATSQVLLDTKKQELIELDGQKNEVLAEIKGLEVDFNDSQLISPVDGVILQINSRVGERPGPDGVLSVGANQIMQALIEVYESDISRIYIGQSVSLTSENGGFKETLNGTVSRISPQVRQRLVLSTDPTGDADARIIEVQVKLTKESVELVRNLTGIKVIARFQPK